MAHYRTREGAARYRDKWRGSLSRRLSGRRELALLRRALRRFPDPGWVLDCPCGAGRLIPALSDLAEGVFAADLSVAMVREARAVADHAASHETRLAAASAMQLPFADRRFDVVVCHRLLHHFPSAETRRSILGELARVARRGVVLSFWDAESRRGRRVVRASSTRRSAITAERLAEEARAVGLVLQSPVLRVNGIVSPQAIASLRKE